MKWIRLSELYFYKLLLKDVNVASNAAIRTCTVNMATVTTREKPTHSHESHREKTWPREYFFSVQLN